MVGVNWTASPTRGHTTGALSPESLKSIAHLDKLANKPAHRDGTQYGSRRGATRSYRRHHISEISSALVYADAETLLAHAEPDCEGAPVYSKASAPRSARAPVHGHCASVRVFLCYSVR